jgi:hypothetical protein
MAQTYTLEEAADKLNLSAEEFKRRLRTEWTQIRSFRDGTTLRFRANEIDELARTYGLGSSDELPLPDAFAETQAPEAGLAAAPPPAHDEPLKLDDSDETFVITPGSSQKLKGGQPADSDVRLKKPAAAADEESIFTQEMEVPADGSGKLSGKSGKLSSAKLKAGDSGKQKAAGASGVLKKGDSGKQKAGKDSSSEFELSLDPDSDEFELSLAPDSSEEVALGEMPADAKGSSKKTGNSGINLNRPTDSGVSLEKKGGPSSARLKKPAPAADDEEIDFELTLDAPGSGASAKKLSSGKLKQDSDSEFELTLEEPSDLAADTAGGEKKADIFEATDFEIPALEDDSASEAVSLEEGDTDLESSSDFDLALDDADAAADDESASEVVELDEAEVKSARKKVKRKVADDDDVVDLGDDDLDAGPSASKALRGVRPDEDEDDDYEVSEAAEDRPVVVAGPTSWGVLPAILMFPTVLVMFLGTLMAFEMLHSTWGYQQANKPTTPLVDFFAEKAGLQPAATM